MATATTTPAAQNPPWIRTTIASFLLAILLQVGLGVPFLDTFVALGILFTMHVVLTEMGTGTHTAWEWIKVGGNMAMGLVVFLALRFLVAKWLGVYPSDTYGKMDDSSGLYGILVGHDVSKIILWEMVFAFVAGKLTKDWATGQSKVVGVVLVVSLIILSVQVALPKYAETLPDRDTVSANLISRGVVGTAWRGTWAFFFGQDDTAPPTHTAVAPTATPAQKPIASCVASMSTPCKMYVGWDTNLKTDGPRAKVRFFGKKEWLEFGAMDRPWTKEEFEPGMAEFLSADPDGRAALVSLYRWK